MQEAPPGLSFADSHFRDLITLRLFDNGCPCHSPPGVDDEPGGQHARFPSARFLSSSFLSSTPRCARQGIEHLLSEELVMQHFSSSSHHKPI